MIMQQNMTETIQKIMDTARAGIYVLDKYQKYIYVNKTYCELLGLKEDEIIGHNVHELLKSGNYSVCVSDSVMKEKRKNSFFSTVYADNGITLREKQLLVRADPILDEKGSIIYIVVTCDPIDDYQASIREAESRSVSTQKASFSRPIREKAEEANMVAESPAMKRVLKTAENAARTDANVLITGETGTGKELMAQFIHANSSRSDKRMIVVNCAALPDNLLESTLFGYEKGAFTGALSSGKKGLLETADGSTLFLDEINSMSLKLQGELLRVLENRMIQPVGSVREIPVDFRLIAATNENLMDRISEGAFRRDLYYRLNILPIDIPSLQERQQDIIPLINHYSELNCRKYKRTVQFDDEALIFMQEYRWPGNIRELRNIVERAVVISEQKVISKKAIEAAMAVEKTYRQTGSYTANTAGHRSDFDNMLEERISLKEYLESCEKEYVGYAIQKFGSTYKAAEALQMSQSSVARRNKKYRPK